MALGGGRAQLLKRVVAVLIIALANASSAQDVDEQDPDLHALEKQIPDTAPAGIPIRIRARSDTRFVIGSDFGNSEADLYWPRGALQVGVPLSKRAAVRFRLSGGAAIYDFSGTQNLFGAGLSSDDPFDNLYSGSFSIEGVYRIDERWAFFTQAFVASRWEDGAAFGDAISGGGALAFGFRVRDRAELILGAGLRSRLDRTGPRPYPLVDIEWAITDNWELRIHGPSAVLEYEFNSRFKTFVRGRLESRRYRLDFRTGGASRGTVRDRQALVGLGFLWRINRHWRIGLTAGAIVEHKLKVRNRNRDTVGKISADPAPFVELRIDLRP